MIKSITVFNIFEPKPNGKFDYYGSRFVIDQENVTVVSNLSYWSESIAIRWAKYYAIKMFSGETSETIPRIKTRDCTNVEVIV